MKKESLLFLFSGSLGWGMPPEKKDDVEADACCTWGWGGGGGVATGVDPSGALKKLENLDAPGGAPPGESTSSFLGSLQRSNIRSTELEGGALKNCELPDAWGADVPVSDVSVLVGSSSIPFFRLSSFLI